MLQTTLDATNAVIKTDPTVTPSDRVRLLAILRAGGAVPKLPVPPTEPCLIRRGEVARRMERSLRSIDLLAKQGILRKIKLPGRIRACGFLESEVEALMQGSSAIGGVSHE